MVLITIMIDGEGMTLLQGAAHGYKSRLVWIGAGFKCWVIGSLSGHNYAQASNLMLQHAIACHIPLISIRYQKQGGEQREFCGHCFSLSQNCICEANDE